MRWCTRGFTSSGCPTAMVLILSARCANLDCPASTTIFRWGAGQAAAAICWCVRVAARKSCVAAFLVAAYPARVALRAATMHALS
jgi:hypothetical protein